MQNNREVLILAELFDGRLSSSTVELCALGRKLADQFSGIAAVILMGKDVRSLAPELISYGMDKVYLIDEDQLQHYHPEVHASVIEQVCRSVRPEALLLGQTLHGRDLGPRLAFRMKTGIATDCVDFAVESLSQSLLVTRPVYGSKALLTLSFLKKPAIATVRSKAVSPAEKNESRTGQIVPFEVKINFAEMKIKYIERVKREAEGPKIEDAKVIVSGGRGLGQAENFKLLEDLANLLGGTVGGSRAAIDKGWLHSTRQVGLTGVIVSPRLYFAIGISGASQHMAGCGSSQCIVAINKDPEAPIFRYARYGVVADFKPVITTMIQSFGQ